MNTDDLRKRADEDEAKVADKMAKMRKKFRVFYSGDENNIDDELFTEMRHPFETFFFNVLLYTEDWFVKRGIISADREANPEAEYKKELIVFLSFIIPITFTIVSVAALFIRILILYFR